MARSLVLGIDTCTKWLNLALLDESGEVLGQVHEPVKTHTTRLVAGLEALLPPTGAGRAPLAALGVVLGPGSFTGLRVGLAAAEGLSASLHLRVHGLDSLTALAMSSRGEGPGMALLDARRGQVYARGFLRESGSLQPLGEPMALAPAEARDLCPSAAWVIGDGVALVTGWPASCLVEDGIPNLGIAAAQAALQAAGRGETGMPLSPLYVRAPDVREPA